MQKVIGDVPVLLMSMKDAFDEGYRLIQNDPCYFLEEPYYTTQ